MSEIWNAQGRSKNLEKNPCFPFVWRISYKVHICFSAIDASGMNLLFYVVPAYYLGNAPASKIHKQAYLLLN